jgi:hypothetical protein
MKGQALDDEGFRKIERHGRRSAWLPAQIHEKTTDNDDDGDGAIPWCNGPRINVPLDVGDNPMPGEHQPQDDQGGDCQAASSKWLLGSHLTFSAAILAEAPRIGKSARSHPVPRMVGARPRVT